MSLLEPWGAGGRRAVHIRRSRRMTESQRRGYSKRDRLLIDPAFLPLAAPESATRPVFVDIGFGMGASLIAFAVEHPDWHCVGVDVFRPGLGAVVERCESLELKNVNLAETDALSFLRGVAPESVDRMSVFFPDPWPKKRHWKRRMVNAEFAESATRVLKDGGILYIATDWTSYADQIRGVMKDIACLDGGVSTRPQFRPTTPYEKKGMLEGRRITDLEYRK